MSTILRKLKSAARLVASPGGLSEVAAVTRRNLRRMAVNRRHGSPFRYRTRSGLDFVCIPNSATSALAYVNDDGYEEIESDLCRKWLRPGDACLDIGANIGLMAASFVARVGKNGLVVSVEPAPATHGFLREAMQLLGHDNVRIEPVCVSDKPGEVPFMVATGAGQDIAASMKIDEHRTGEFEQVMVPAVTINDLINKHAIADRLSMVKIDIEGAEPMAFRGASRLFERDRLPLFVAEVHKAALANFGLEPMDTMRFFPTDLFELFHVQRSRTDLTPRFDYGRLYPLPDPARHEWPWYSNIVAVPRSGKYADRRNAIAPLLPL